MTMRVICYGASGHGKVVADVIAAAEVCELVGFVDDDPLLDGASVGGVPVIGGASILRNVLRSDVSHAIVTIGSCATRVNIAAKLKEMGFCLTSAVHPAAVIAPDVRVGPGTVVMAGAVINPGTTIGENVVVNTGATIDHDCVLGDGAHVAPGAHLAGHVRVGRLALIGLGASVIPRMVIGEESRVGAGAVVIREVPTGATVAGNPARVV